MPLYKFKVSHPDHGDWYYGMGAWTSSEKAREDLLERVRRKATSRTELNEDPKDPVDDRIVVDPDKCKLTVSEVKDG